MVPGSPHTSLTPEPAQVASPQPCPARPWPAPLLTSSAPLGPPASEHSASPAPSQGQLVGPGAATPAAAAPQPCLPDSRQPGARSIACFSVGTEEGRLLLVSDTELSAPHTPTWGPASQIIEVYRVSRGPGQG